MERGTEAEEAPGTGGSGEEDASLGREEGCCASGEVVGIVGGIGGVTEGTEVCGPVREGILGGEARVLRDSLRSVRSSV